MTADAKTAPTTWVGAGVGPWGVFAAIAAASGLVLLVVGRGLGFFEDDWQFIVERPFTLEAAFRHWGEHWPVLHFAIFRGAYELSGGSYLALHVVLVGIHITAGAGLFALLRREGPEAYALAATAVFLIAAPGWENTMWAFQIGFVLAMAFGLWSLYVRDDRSAALLLVLGVMTSGSVAPFIAAGMLRALLERDWRGAAWRVSPGVLYGGWILFGGAAAERANGFMAWDLAALASAVTYAVTAFEGLGRSYLGNPVAALLLVAVVVGVAVKPTPLAVTALVAFLAYPAMLALTRNEFGPTVTLWSRHVYAMTPWLLLAAVPLATVVGRYRVGRIAGAGLLAAVLLVEVVSLPGYVHDAGDRVAADRVECRFGCP